MVVLYPDFGEYPYKCYISWEVTIPTILIRGARQLLTLRGSSEPRRGRALEELAIIQDGSVLIHDGVLCEVGPTRRVENLALARNAIEVNAAGRVVMPGFVDSHTHMLFPLARNGEAGQSEAAQSIHTIGSTRLAARARVHLEAMARHGTTTVEVKTGCGPDPAAETKILRVLAGLKQKPVDVVPTFLLQIPESKVGPEALSDAIENWIGQEFLPKLRRRRLVSFGDVCLREQPASLSTWTRYLDLVEQAGLRPKLHAEGTATGAAVELALRYRAISVDHLEQATAPDAAALGRAETIATLLPSHSFHHDGPYAPARALIDAGAAVALATNYNPCLTPTLNMQAVIQLACSRMGMTAAEAVSAATINGAHSLVCSRQVGSLEPGKVGDVLVLNIADYRELAHHFGTNLVHTTVKCGEVIWEEGRVAPRQADELRPSW